jgi:aryl-alcohol dehydrogenase-like predicted oxidoreductase
MRSLSHIQNQHLSQAGEIMTEHREFNGQMVPALGLGCWAIGGRFYSGETPLGWGDVDDAVSISAIQCAVDHGIRFFDTAQVYGTGRSETVLGKALAKRYDVKIGTKVGYGIDPVTKQLVGEVKAPQDIMASVEKSLKRLQRNHIDIINLHLNELPIAEAAPIFECLELLRTQGKISSYGWSTDFPDRAAAFAAMEGFVAIQHAMNVFYRADMLIPTVEQNGLLSINRSPLAMGLLGGKHDASTKFDAGEVRGRTATWMDYFADGRIRPEYATRLANIRELLQADGRSLVQGALCWLWARSQKTLPIPGFRNTDQVKDIAGALNFGPLGGAVMADIETLINREPEGAPRAR